MTIPVAHGSIRRRLLVLLLLGAAALAILLYFVVQSVARQVAQQSQDNVLAASAMSVMESARFANGEMSVDLPYSALSMLDSVTDERVFYAIRMDQELLTGYGDLPRVPGLQTGRASFLSATFLDEDVRIASVRRSMSTDTGQAVLEVSVAQTLAGQRLTLAWMSRMSLGIGGGFFTLCAVLALIVARSTIRPLDTLTASVSRRGPQDLRPVSAPVPLEMVPLVTSLNGFMGRLQASLSRSEDFIAEAAHRVRTPLAIVRTRAEIIQRSVSKPENREAIREMIHAIDDSSRTAGQLLDHAMVALRLDHLQEAEIDLAALLTETVDRLRPVSDIKGIAIEVAAAPSTLVVGDGILVQNALHNLLDNAIKYSPEYAQIRVALTRGPDCARIDIRDNGPGFPSGDLQRLTGRFERGDNAAGIVGSGLGLTIAKDVVEAHGGRLEIGNQAGGGACASLYFPLS